MNYLLAIALIVIVGVFLGTVMEDMKDSVEAERIEACNKQGYGVLRLGRAQVVCLHPDGRVVFDGEGK